MISIKLPKLDKTIFDKLTFSYLIVIIYYVPHMPVHLFLCLPTRGGRGQGEGECAPQVRMMKGRSFCNLCSMQVVLQDQTTREEEDNGFSFLELGKQNLQVVQFAIIVFFLISV